MKANGVQSVGILGGTFNPVHYGHIAIAKSFLASAYIDSLLILLTPSPPHKQGCELAGYSERLRMLMAAFSDVEGTKVSNLEFTLPKPSYTYQTVRYLKKCKPEVDYFYCLGEDSFHQFKSWYNWQGILKYCDLLVAERPGVKHENGELNASTHFVKHKPLEISSSQIRAMLRNELPIAGLVPEQVRQIITHEKLYQ